jgi:hypothetical protein
MPNFFSEIKRSFSEGCDSLDRSITNTFNGATNMIENSVHDPITYKKKLEKKSTQELQQKSVNLRLAAVRDSTSAVTAVAAIATHPATLTNDPVRKIEHPLIKGKSAMKKGFRSGHVTARLRNLGEVVPPLSPGQVGTAMVRGGLPSLIATHGPVDPDDFPALHDQAKTINDSADLLVRAEKTYGLYEKHQVSILSYK